MKTVWKQLTSTIKMEWNVLGQEDFNIIFSSGVLPIFFLYRNMQLKNKLITYNREVRTIIINNETHNDNNLKEINSNNNYAKKNNKINSYQILTICH